MEEVKQSNEITPDNSETPSAPVGTGPGKKRRAGIIIVLLLVTGTVIGVSWWVKSKTHITTDNAFVEARIHSISAKIPGTVIRVLVKENQPVKKGDLLVEIDSADYRVQEKNVAAELETARNDTSGDYANIEAAKAAVEFAQAKLNQAELDLKRGKALYAKEVIPKVQLDRLETALKVADSQFKAIVGNLRKDLAKLGLSGQGGKDARIKQKQAKLEEAELHLSYTRIYAPTDGYITRKSVEPGNNLQPGQPLMALVALDDSWITANYKESQLTYVKPGLKVDFEVDAYPGQKFRGSVESIMAGTGAAFSLLPPENATGNYVKVVQRIPVRIAIDKTSDPDHRLRVGMSVVPSIITGRKLGDILKELNPF